MVQQLFDYSIPDELIHEVTCGSIVTVPFGNQLCLGLVLSVGDADQASFAYSLKSVKAVLASGLIDYELRQLVVWVAEHYMCDMVSAASAVIPWNLLFSKSVDVVTLCALAEQLAEYQASTTLSSVEKDILGVFSRLEYKNISIAALEKKICSSPSQFKLSLKNLQKLGLVKVQQKFKLQEQPSDHTESRLQDLQPLKSLNSDQQSAFNEIVNSLNARSKAVILLQGVTGSGKTEVYLAAMRYALSQGRGAICLVPEITLTESLLTRFMEVFSPDELCVWHSNLSDQQRRSVWWKVAKGEIRAVLATRSGIFLPVNQLGLVIIDEEHDSAYKNSKVPLYDLRAVGLHRAATNKAVFLAGSATPSVTMSYLARSTNGNVVILPHRYHSAGLPEVEVVDMRRELMDGNTGFLSRSLFRSLEETLSRGEGAILLINRRGYAQQYFCRSCGYVQYCSDCSVPMVWHSAGNKLLCHHCGLKTKPFDTCASCNGSLVGTHGLGTQRIEAIISELHRGTKVIRLDSDSAGKVLAAGELRYLNDAASDKPFVLIGTQMVAKGIDIPKVTLVGILRADAGLHLGDYMASERTFALLTQASGRAGRRDAKGKVIVQSYCPEHPVMNMAAHQNYDDFYNWELTIRRRNNYPPFGRICRVLLSNPSLQQVEEDSDRLMRYLKSKLKALDVLGPSLCPLEKLHNKYRMHILIKGKNLDELRILVKTNNIKAAYKSKVIFDVAPNNLL